MELVINGKKREVDARTIQEVIAFYGLAGKPLAVEVDGAIVRKEQWETAEVRPRMQIELVHFVGGG